MLFRSQISLDITKLFTQVSLTANYYLNLQHAIKGTFSEYNGIYYTLADILQDVYNLVLKLLSNIIRRSTV